MKVNERVKSNRSITNFAVVGFVLGLFYATAAYMVQAITSPDVLIAGTVWNILWALHKHNPVLLIVDNAPIVLAIAGAIIGKKQQEKSKYLERLRAVLEERDQQLKSIRFRYAKMLEKVDECLFVTTPDGRILDINKAGVTLLKIETLFKKKVKSKEELLSFINQKGPVAKIVCVDEKERNQLLSEVEKKGTVSNYQIRLKRFNGESFDALVTVSLERDVEGEPAIFTRIIDLSAVKRAEVLLKKANIELEKKNKELMNAFSELQVLKIRYEKRSIELHRKNAELERLNKLFAEMAMLDGLTELYNHRHFMGLLRREWERARRGKRNFCVLMIDIDYFKAFNDKYGHHVGDEVLKTVAKTIKNQTREYDIVARYGGEEFSVILPDTDLTTCYTVALRIRKAIEEKVLWVENKQKETHLTVSVGVTIFLPEDEDPRTHEQVLQDADVALYLAKNRGRNRVEMYRRDFLSESVRIKPVKNDEDVP